jgi:divalent metal cation (Fe/Co/Zn/Cd) transporter
VREVTASERSQERTIFWTNSADVVITVALAIVAVASGSLTIFSEVVRSVLLLIINYYSLWLLYAMHRRRLERYEYGVDKLEQFVWTVIGVAFVLGALWITHSIVDKLFAPEAIVTPIGLAIAAVVNAINNVINASALYAMFAGSEDRRSGVFGAQVRARIGMLLATGTLQVTLTVAAFAKDPAISLYLDALGASLVVLINLRIGIVMLAQSIPVLLDASAVEEVASQVRSSVRKVVSDDHIVAIRTRRLVNKTIAEVSVREAAFPDIEALRERTAEIQHDLRRAGAAVELAVVIAE